jgi:hypothetical protein
MIKSKKTRLAQEKAELIRYLTGDFTEAIAKRRLSMVDGGGYRFIDGHEPFRAPNFPDVDGTPPKNLDIVRIELATGNVTEIYEVKSTTTDGNEFDVNGQCGMFMEHARKLGIPTYIIVVRMDRQLDEDIMHADENGDIRINKQVYESEFKHFLESAKIEIYQHDAFRIENGKFIIGDGKELARK